MAFEIERRIREFESGRHPLDLFFDDHLFGVSLNKSGEGHIFIKRPEGETDISIPLTSKSLESAGGVKISRGLGSQINGRFIEGYWENYLRELYGDERSKERVLNNFSRATKYDLYKIQNFDLETEQEMEEFDSPFFRGLIRAEGFLFNLVLVGRPKRTDARDISELVERYLAWGVIEESTEKMCDTLPKYLECSDFYGRLSSDAQNGKNRMDRLLIRTGKIYGAFFGENIPDYQSILDGLRKKIQS